MFGFFGKTTKKPIFVEPPPKPIEPFKNHSPIELKIKALSLTAEARIIKRLERKLKRKYPIATMDGYNPKTDKQETIIHYGPSPLLNPRRAEQFFRIQGHRLKEVREEARATHLARAFLKGKPYHEVEQKAYEFPINKLKYKIEAMVRKYAWGDSRLVAQRFEEWCQDAANYYHDYWEIANRVQKLEQEEKENG